MKTIAKITDSNINEIIGSDSATLVIFTTPDCGYCYILKDNILEVVDQIPDLKVYECQIGEAPEAVQRFAVKSLPQFKVFRNGEVIYTGLGVPRPADLYYQLKAVVRDTV